MCSALAWAQGTAIATAYPYTCSYEESENLSAWTLNYGTPSATDLWMYGTAVHSEGRRSLYPSADGVNPVYGQNQNITVAYLRYKFPTATSIQKYDISFDWKGVGDSTTSKLYVMFGTEADFFPANPNATGAKNLYKIVGATRLSNAQINACENLGDPEDPTKELCGSVAWQNVSFANDISVSANNSSKTFMCVFIWVNENTTDTTNNSSIAIDNFQINTAAIKKPSDLKVYPQCEDSSLLVMWDGKNAEAFDIQYRKMGDPTWAHTFGDVSADNEGFVRDGTMCSYAIRPVLEGSYEVRVRGKGDGLVTSYVYTSNILVYCPENHCINYVDLYSPNVTCTYGFNPNAHAGATPYDNIGVIDYGPQMMESRHTLHVDPTEMDPRTDSLLHTVPPGALASVRLGNWWYQGEAESITYDILVDSTNQGILIVKYAIVFENPPGHDDAGQPRFNLEVLDQNGNLIDQTCGHAEFTYESGVAAGWHMTHDEKAAWKDWTTVGVNLMPYHGQNIKVRFTTMDCGWSGHYAYAYFTVDCANAHIETDNCGTDAFVQCVAPEGFAYMWYKDHNPDSVVSYDQTLEVEASRHDYTCRVSFIEQPDCYFEISTTSEPRFPVPDYTIEPIYENCQSKLKFVNNSHVMNKYDGEEHHKYNERTNDARWTFRSLTQGATQPKVTTAWSPTYTCRDIGDTIEVTYTTYIGANNSCDSTRVDTIITPNIIPEKTEIYHKSCSEEPIKFDDQWFNTDTIYTAHFTTYAGCDSVSTLYLKVYPHPEDLYIHDSICSNQTLTINGVKYNQPLDNYLIMLKTVNGCDSAIYLTLTVNQLLQATIDSFPYACADEEQMYIAFDIAAGVYDSLVIEFDTPELRDTVIYEQVTSVLIPYSANILPGHYSAHMTFYQFCCGKYEQTRGFDLRYRSSIVEQKWNDVLTLLSPKYNGGYEFISFQWYKNDMPLPGETHSYLYQPLDFDAEYYVEMMRKDSVLMKTCPIQPVYHEQQTEYPTIVPAGQYIQMYMEHAVTIWYYTISGQLYSTFTLPQGYTSLATPTQPGMYVLKSVTADGETKAQVMIVQ